MGVRGTTNLEENGRKGKKSRRPSKVVKVFIYYAEVPCFKAYIKGNREGSRGNLTKKKKQASADMRAEVRLQVAGTLCFISRT